MIYSAWALVSVLFVALVTTKLEMGSRAEWKRRYEAEAERHRHTHSLWLKTVHENAANGYHHAKLARRIHRQREEIKKLKLALRGTATVPTIMRSGE